MRLPWQPGWFLCRHLSWPVDIYEEQEFMFSSSTYLVLWPCMCAMKISGERVAKDDMFPCQRPHLLGGHYSFSSKTHNIRPTAFKPLQLITEFVEFNWRGVEEHTHTHWRINLSHLINVQEIAFPEILFFQGTICVTAERLTVERRLSRCRKPDICSAQLGTVIMLQDS